MSDSNEIVICVDSFCGTNCQSLILCHPTGVHYKATCGGGHCFIATAEGIFFPFYGKFKTDSCENGCWNINSDDWKERGKGEPDEIATKLAKLFDEEFMGYSSAEIHHIEFDWSRLSELMEGWCPVKVVMCLGYPKQEMKFNGYLLTGNCD